MQAARMADQEEEWRRGIEAPPDPRDQVDAEDESPELALGGGAGRQRLSEPHLALREAVLPARLDAVERVGGGLAVELDDGRILRAGAATPFLRIREPEGRPDLIGTVGEAGDGRANRVVHMPARLERVLERHDARAPPRARIVAQREARTVGAHLRGR